MPLDDFSIEQPFIFAKTTIFFYFRSNDSVLVHRQFFWLHQKFIFDEPIIDHRSNNSWFVIFAGAKIQFFTAKIQNFSFFFAVADTYFCCNNKRFSNFFLSDNLFLLRKQFFFRLQQFVSAVAAFSDVTRINSWSSNNLLSIYAPATIHFCHDNNFFMSVSTIQLCCGRNVFSMYQ